MKRGILLLLAFGILSAALFAGGKPQKGADRQPKIGVTIFKLDDTFMTYICNSLAASAKGRAVLEMVDSQNSQLVQNKQIDFFLANKYNALVINTVDSNDAALSIEKAKVRNTPVVFLVHEPLPDDMALWDKIYYVGAKAEESGSMQGEIIAEYWKTHPEADKNNDGILQYITIKGEPNHQTTELRTEYSAKALAAAGIRAEKLAEEPALWDRSLAAEQMSALYSQFGEGIEAVFANNDDMALGVIDALRQEGYFRNGKFLPVVGVDATVYALQSIAQGILLGTVLNDAKNQGKAAFELAFVLGRGQDVSNAGWPIANKKYVWIPYQKVTKNNYTLFQ
jgi:methyl-galactoside transport system substrate-binding protein